MLMLSVKDEKEAELYLSAPALQDENKALKELLREVEGGMWDYARGGIRECFICKGKFMFGGHTSGCRLNARLKEE